MKNPVIIVVAYNRSVGLNRLLSSLDRAVYPSKDIPLIMSIDGDGSPDVVEISNLFSWRHGTKRVLCHNQHLGLKNHILSCGELTTEVGNIIILEDDLVVSPQFYRFAIGALDYYCPSDHIAGISLYQYQITENGFFPFTPLGDEFSTYFMQVPSSWGQVWTPDQWKRFRQWLDRENTRPTQVNLPSYVDDWPDTSWKKTYFKYLISMDQYFVYPRGSYSTNFGDPGTHTDRKGLFQVPLIMKPPDGRFARFTPNCIRYDAWFECHPDSLKSRITQWSALSLTIDLYGTKSPDSFNSEYVLTTRRSSCPEHSFALEMIPPVQNVIEGIPGNRIFLTKTEFIIDSPLPPNRQFYQTESIHEDIFENIITRKAMQAGRQMFQNMKSQLIFEQTYPKLLIITPVITPVKWDEIHRIKGQTHYPNLEHVIVDFTDISDKPDLPGDILFFRKPKANIGAAIDGIISEVCPEMIIIAGAGCQISPDAPASASEVFTKFRDIQWLNSAGVAGLREDQCRWSRTGLRSLQGWMFNESLRFSNVIFKRQLWESAKADFLHASLFHEVILWKAFALQTELYTINTSISTWLPSATEFHPVKPETDTKDESFAPPLSHPNVRKILSALMYPAYRYQIPVFRSLYAELNRIPAMIRWDTSTNSCYVEW